MDTSETYIRMCEKARGIQIDWIPGVGDYVWRKYTVFGEEIDRKIWSDPKQSIEIIILHYKSMVEGYYHACNQKGQARTFKTNEEMEKTTSIFLPRQDQLQEMAIPCMNSETMAYYLTAVKNFNDPERSYKSMEQLWLAFVMKEKFGKTWNGEGWMK